MAIRAIYPQVAAPDAQHIITEASLYTEDGRPDRRVVGIDLQSWEEILPYIYSLHLRVEAAPTSPRYRDRDRDRERERPRRESPGLEVRFHR
jgi:hypothetical protein